MANGLAVPGGVPKGKAGMNPKVIEAAERAYANVRTWQVNDKAINADGKPSMEAAIDAAMMALAPDIRTAVRMLSGAAQHYVDAGWRYGETDERTEQAADGVMEARRDLFALLGIEDTTDGLRAREEAR